MGEITKVSEHFVGQWLGPSNIDELHFMASDWSKGSDLLPTRDRNQRFLSTFAIHLVSYFCSEERGLEQTRSLDRKPHCHEHRMLARELRGLMVDLQHGLDRTSQISAFLTKWRLHELNSTESRMASKDLGH